MRKYLLLLTLALTGWVYTERAEAHLLVLEISDSHSAYNNLPHFIQKIAKLRHDFQHEYPGGQVVLIVNGDFAGKSGWARDYGQLGYDVLALLAREFRIVVVPGNHEAFDWMGEQGNRLFLDQHRALQRQISVAQQNPFFVTAANMTTTDDAATLFRPFVDVPYDPRTPERVVRISGLVLKKFFRVSDYDRRASTQIFTAVRDPLAVAKEVVQGSLRDGVDRVIFACHDIFRDVVKLREQLDAWQASRRESVHITASFAGHDHKVVSDRRLRVFDGGAHFAGTGILVNNRGFISRHFFFEAGEEPLGSTEEPEYLRPSEKMALRLVRHNVAETRALLDQVVGIAGRDFDEHKHDLKERRTVIGTLIADSLREWADRQIEDSMSPPEALTEATFGFFNSSSFRRERPFGAGNITYGDYMDVYPYSGSPQIAYVRGRDVETLYWSLRRFKFADDGGYTPQPSSNMRLVPGGKASDTETLEVRVDGEWSPIKKMGWYVLALDPWLGRNGYRVPEWTVIFRRTRWLPVDPSQSFVGVLYNHLAPLMAAPDCPETFADLLLFQ